MDEQRAKFLLQSGPPRKGDREDPAFVEALAHLETDPALAQWTRRQAELTEGLAAKLAEIEVPANLKNQILAGGFVSRRSYWHRRRTWLAAAAMFVALLGLAIWQWGGGSGGSRVAFAAFRSDMCEFLSGTFQLEVQSPSLERLRAHLDQTYQFINYVVPTALAAERGVGCRMIEWQGRQVALICFTSQGQLVHLVMLPRAELPAESLPVQNVREQLGEWATAGWMDEQNVYLVATRGSAELLEGLL